ncbi:Uncharacterised protein [Enterobacter cloacae]|nr:Uncharacterised protein [Enterobacter cloacae]
MPPVGGKDVAIYPVTEKSIKEIRTAQILPSPSACTEHATMRFGHGLMWARLTVIHKFMGNCSSFMLIHCR